MTRSCSDAPRRKPVSHGLNRISRFEPWRAMIVFSCYEHNRSSWLHYMYSDDNNWFMHRYYIASYQWYDFVFNKCKMASCCRMLHFCKSAGSYFLLSTLVFTRGLGSRDPKRRIETPSIRCLSRYGTGELKDHKRAPRVRRTVVAAGQGGELTVGRRGSDIYPRQLPSPSKGLPRSS